MDLAPGRHVNFRDRCGGVDLCDDLKKVLSEGQVEGAICVLVVIFVIWLTNN